MSSQNLGRLDFGLSRKQITAGTYTRQELIDFVEGQIKLTQFDKDSRIRRINELEHVTEMVISLGELSNTDNLEHRRHSNIC